MIQAESTEIKIDQSYLAWKAKTHIAKGISRNCLTEPLSAVRTVVGLSILILMLSSCVLTGSGAESCNPVKYGETYGRSKLVCIGINDYTKEEKLECARLSATNISSLFKGLGFEPVCLLDKAATKRSIQDTVRNVLTGSGPDDRIVIYFAGHGIESSENDTCQGYLIPVNGDEDRIETLIPFRWIHDVASDLKTCRAKHVLFILDCCFSGMMKSYSNSDNRKRAAQTVTDCLQTPARYVITSGSDLHRVKDSLVFTEALRAGFVKNAADQNNDDFITGSELYSFLSYIVSSVTRGAQQPDEAWLKGSMGGDILLKLPENKAVQ